METNKIEHLKRLVISDNNNCTEQLQAINISDFSQQTKETLCGFFRKRTEFNYEILEDLEKIEKINTNT